MSLALKNRLGAVFCEVGLHAEFVGVWDFLVLEGFEGFGVVGEGFEAVGEAVANVGIVVVWGEDFFGVTNDEVVGDKDKFVVFAGGGAQFGDGIAAICFAGRNADEEGRFMGSFFNA